MCYRNDFLHNYVVRLPKINDTTLFNTYSVNNYSIKNFLLDYNNYSLLHNPLRCFPFYTATNINGKLFKKIPRNKIFSTGNDKWQKDVRIPTEVQLGKELYSAKRSNFDKGHLVKREDVQWGNTLDLARKAAASTFCFTNAVPQVSKLNRGVWKRIENYILHSEVVKNNLKVSLFTGPVLDDNDPDFVTEVEGRGIKLPTLFWKVVYYEKNKVLYRTGFLTSQYRLLKKKRIIKPTQRSGSEVEDFFMNFKDADTYQVNISLIEKLTGLLFSEAEEVYKSEKPERLVLSAVDVRSENLTESSYIVNIKL